MDLTNRTVIKDLFRKYGVRPEKYLGQHFILSKKALAQMVAAAEIKKNDTIFEIGPGLGALTQELAKNLPGRRAGGAKIVAIEKDPEMISILKETLVDYKNIKIVQADARELSILRIDSFGDKLGIKIAKNKYKIVANLPYNIATFLIRQWLDPPSSPPNGRIRRARPELMVLMIQKEVAQRICAKPHFRQGYGGQAPMNLLAVSVQFYADAKIIGYVPAEAFWPKPKVDSAIIKIVPKRSKRNDCIKPIGLKQSFTFFAVVKAGFSQPRKQLIGNLTKKLTIPKEEILSAFKKLDIPERTRAENLSLEQWILLAKEIENN